MTILLRLITLTWLLIAPTVVLAGNEIQGTITAKLNGGEERQWFSALSYDEPTSTYYSGETLPQMVTIEAKADITSARDVISLEFTVVGDFDAPRAQQANLVYNPGSGIFPHYTSQYEDIQVTITSIAMAGDKAAVAGSFSAKLTRVGPASQDGEQDFTNIVGTFEVEAWPVSY